MENNKTEKKELLKFFKGIKNIRFHKKTDIKVINYLETCQIQISTNMTTEKLRYNSEELNMSQLYYIKKIYETSKYLEDY